MKKLCVVMLFIVGCVPTRMEIQTLTDDVDTLMVKIDDYQEKYAEEVDKVQEHIVAVNEVVKEKADESALEQVRAGWDTTKEFNPYYAYGALALTILGEATALWKLNNKKNKLENKRQADKEGRELALREIAAMSENEITAPIVKAKMYKAIGDARRGNGIT